MTALGFAMSENILYYGKAAAMGEENHADHLAAIRNPDTVRAMLEDYRAGLTVDRAAEEADRAAGRRVTCPTLVLWSEKDDMEELYGDPIAIWSAWCDDVRAEDNMIADNASGPSGYAAEPRVAV